MKTYVLKAELEKDEDGRWSAWVDGLPGCTAWGKDEQEALAALKDAADVYIADMLEAGEKLPRKGVEVVESPVVAVTI